MSNGTTQIVTTQATWQSSAAGVATSSTTGFITAVAAGEADIRATYQNVTGTAHISVTAPPPAAFSVCGTVQEEGGTTPIAGATVIVKDTALSTSSDSNGKYCISLAGSGRIVLRATRSGYDLAEVDLTVNGSVTVDIPMRNSSSPSPTPAPPTPPPSPNPGLACGVERWFVKTLADADASRVNPSSVTPMSISELNALPSHCEAGPDRRVFAEEFRVFEVVGRVTYVAHEDDRDYHIALEDPSRPGTSVVTELADTVCMGASMSPHLATLRSVEGMFASVLSGRSPSTLVGTILRVRGVGFYDFNHGQRGRSTNCIELHPITGIERISGS